MLVATPPAPAHTSTVRYADVTISRPQLRIGRGDSVRWVDEDKHVTHTVTSKGRPRFESSRTLRFGDEHRVRFNRRGTYAYVCEVHPASMRGAIDVV